MKENNKPAEKKEADAGPKKPLFTRYQVFVIAILAILQFTIILDFMVLSPLGAILIPKLSITAAQFSHVVSGYAFSAGIAGILAAGFADKFDRKRLLLFFYVGFILGTVLCAIAPNYHMLLIARIITGLFGGVIGSVSFAIITDLFRMETRGRVMGFVQMAFAASQVLGIPIGLELANKFGWHYPFWMIAVFGTIVGVVILVYLKPVSEHLKLKNDRNALAHLWHTATQRDYLTVFLATTLLATGGFMIMPFGSTFTTGNLKISADDLPLMYTITGVFSIIFGPLIGKFSDKIGKYTMFIIGSIVSTIMLVIYSQLGPSPFYLVVMLNVLLFVGISSRMISSSSLVTAIPTAQDRGAFMSINASVQQLAGGIASIIAGTIVVVQADGYVQHYDTLCYVVIGTMTVAVGLMYFLNRLVKRRLHIAANQPV